MKILLTGYTGLLGKVIGEQLVKQGYEVICPLNITTVNIRNIPKNIEVTFCSLQNHDKLSELISKVDGIIHCAWSFDVSSKKRPTLNEITSQFLIDRAKKFKLMFFIFISSVAVYGMKTPTDQPISEVTIPIPKLHETQLYPSQKISIEKYINSISHGQTKFLIYRPGPIFSNSRGPTKKRIKIGNHTLAIGIGKRNTLMNLIHVQDVAEAVCLGMKNGTDMDIFNVISTQARPKIAWFKSWCRARNIRGIYFFIPGVIIQTIGFTLNVILRLLKKDKQINYQYVIDCADRTITYDNDFLRNKLGWQDLKTDSIFI